MGFDQGAVDEINGQDISPESVTTEDLDIDGADLAASGDIIGLNTASFAVRDFSTTSNSYDFDENQIQHRITPEKITPDGGQLAVTGECAVSVGTDETVDLLIRTVDDVITEKKGITSSGNQSLGPVNWTPSNPGTQNVLTFRLQTNPGTNSSILRAPTIQVGVQL